MLHARFRFSREDDALDADDLPVLVPCEDQDSANYAARWFRLYVLQSREFPIDDIFHRLWNDLLASIKDAMLYSIILVTTMAMNLAWGPWQGEKWHVELIEGATRFFKAAKTGSTDWLLEKFLPKVLADLGLPLTDQARGEALDDLLKWLEKSGFLQKKGNKVAMARWFSWFKSMEWWSPQWNCRLIILVYLGVRLGFITEKNRECIVANLKSTGVQSTSGDGVEKETMHASKSQAAQLRDQCVNALHVTMLIHAKERYIWLARMIFHVATSCHEWYSEHAHGLRGRKATFDFMVGMAHGSAWLPSLCDVPKVFSDLQKMGQMGFLAEELVTKETFQNMSTTNPLLQDQLDHAVVLFTLIFALMKRRLASLTMYSNLYPYKFALLVHPDAEVVKLGRAACKLAWEVWSSVQRQTLPAWKRIQRRSCFVWTLVKDIMARLKKVNFEYVPADVATLLQRLLSAFATSKLVEDAMNKSRRKEKEYDNKQQVPGIVLWLNLVEELVIQCTPQTPSGQTRKLLGCAMFGCIACCRMPAVVSACGCLRPGVPSP